MPGWPHRKLSETCFSHNAKDDKEYEYRKAFDVDGWLPILVILVFALLVLLF